jgi:hypothetical protein
MHYLDLIKKNVYLFFVVVFQSLVAEINGWDYVTKSFYLAGSLKRGAIALLNELDKESRKDYNSLIRVLHTRYGSAEVRII